MSVPYSLNTSLVPVILLSILHLAVTMRVEVIRIIKWENQIPALKIQSGVSISNSID